MLVVGISLLYLLLKLHTFAHGGFKLCDQLNVLIFEALVLLFGLLGLREILLELINCLAL